MIKQFLRQYLLSRQERYYLKNRWHFFLDLGLLALIIVLVTILATLASFRPAAIDTSAPVHQPKAEAPAPIDISNPPLDLDFEIKNKVLDEREAAAISIVMHNNGREEIGDLSLTFSCLDDDCAISRLAQTSGADDLDISKSTINKLKIAEQTSRTLDLSVTFKNLRAGKRLVRWQITVTYSLNGQSFKQTLRLPDLRRAAEIAMKARAFYTSPQGDQLGSGPLPPVVGLPTRYWIFWEIGSQADLEGLVVTAKLPPAVTITDQQAVLNGEFAFQPDSRQIIWKVPRLKAEDGPARLSFALEIIPTASQAGKTPILQADGRYVALDVLTGERIAGKFQDITTNLTDDQLNSDLGTVVTQDNE